MNRITRDEFGVMRDGDRDYIPMRADGLLLACWCCIAVTLLSMLLGSGCTPLPPPSPIPPTGATCEDSCARARELGCPWGDNTPGGASCETVCAAAQELEPWDLNCRTRAPSCDVQERCEE